MRKFIASLIFVGSFTHTSFAQQKAGDTNSLLWRISGKNLSRPSYIFGTMHLTDKRIFNFSDSLYHSLETTEGFAAELNMEEVMPQMITEMRKEENSDKPIVLLVKPDLLNPYKYKLEENLKMPLDKITVRDLKRARSKLTNQLLKTGEMNTIIDMYLFDIAKRQGKWVGGIEDLEDQFKPGEDGDEIISMIKEAAQNQVEIKNELERMIKIYVKQDLNALDLSNTLWKGAENSVLIRRNMKMARRMDSLMNIRTCFFAVGAAHLPGDSGVIEFLRKRGFIMEPVLSSKTIEPSKYTFKEKEFPWVETPVKDNWYTLLMPGKASELKLEEDIPFGMQMYVDLSRMYVYLTLGTAITKERKMNSDSLFRGIAQNFSKKGAITSEKNIIVNGDPGKEFIIKSDDMDMRLQAFLPQSSMVVNMMASYKHDSLYGKDAEHFFTSFHILKAAPPLPEVLWKTYTFSNHAFSIKFPAVYKEQKRDQAGDSIWRTKLYVANNVHGSTEISCGMMVMEAKKGFYSDTDSAYFKATQANVLAATKAELTGSFFLKSEGFPGYVFKGKILSEKVPLLLNVKILNRGNRRYYFYAVYSDSEEGRTEADIFFNSFQFLPIPVQEWKYRETPEKDIAVWSPAPPDFQKNAVPGTFAVYDSSAPATVIIKKEIISPYLWWKNDSTFFKQQAHRFMTETDSLTAYQVTRNGAMHGADFCVLSKDNHNLKKVSLMVNADTLYYLVSHLAPDLLSNADYTRLFNDIKFSTIKGGSYYLTNKTARILKDMSSGDSASFEKALDALENAALTTADLPLLQKALLQPYRDFSPLHYCAHDKLLNKVLGTDDGSTYHFVKNEYPLLKDSAGVLRYSFLSLLLRLKTKESFDLFKKFVEQQLPPNGNAMMLEYSLKDSLQLTAAIFPSMLALSADTGFVKLLTPVSDKLLDSSLTNIQSFDPYKKYFYSFAEKQLKKIKQEKPVFDQGAYDCVGFLSHFKDPASYQLQQQFLLTSTMAVKNAAAVSLIRNGQKADLIQLEKIAADDYYRLELYSSLKDLGKEKFFPQKYLTQPMFAKSELYQYASDEYNADSVIFISEKLASFRGKSEKFYLFRITRETDDGARESYLGIAGPYSKIPGKILTSSAISGVYNENYDPKKINQQFQAYLKQQEKYPDGK